MREIHRDTVAALIFSRDGKLLQGKKDPKKGGVYLDCWHIPGGGIDDGESQKDTLIREVYEEVGIDISKCEMTLVDDEGTGQSRKTLPDTSEEVLCNMNFNIYEIHITDRDADEIPLILEDDLVEAQWHTLADQKNLTLTPPSVELFKRLGYL